MYDGTISGAGLQTGPFSDTEIVSQGVSAPAAGADFTVTVPNDGAIRELVAISAQLATSSAVANRVVTLLVKDYTGTEVFRYANGTSVTASLTIVYCLSPQFTTTAGDIAATKQFSIPIPRGPYLPGFKISSSTAAIDTADQWSHIQAWWRLCRPDYGSGGTD